MALPQLKLDERGFQDLVDEAKLRIPRYCPEWTNHNVSDPGVTLIELFAYMVDQLLYQVNRVPEKNYRAFLDMIGVRLAPPNPARTDVIFRLSASQPNPITIPKHTEVATVRTESQNARIFTTEHDLLILPPNLKYVLTTPNSQIFTDVSRVTLTAYPQEIEIFQENPQPDNAFYLGFDNNIARNTLVVGLDCEKLGVGINPNEAPLSWEYWDEKQNEWLPMVVASDTTQGLTTPYSEVELYVPFTAGQREIEPTGGSENTILAYWIRCRYKELTKNQPGYIKSPVVRNFSAYTIGGTASVSHSQIVRLEELGRSTGEPGQVFRLKNVPMLALNPSESETILTSDLEDEHPPQVWKQVPDFSESGPNDLHFVCDYVTGEVSFGPALRNPLGQETQHGFVPPYGNRIIINAYRTGGGVEGNVGSQTITVLKTSIPYVDRVINLLPATGGTNPETLEQALMRGPRTLRARNRAVTAEDFEVLTREATSGVARVRCLAPGQVAINGNATVEPGVVVLVVVPEVEEEIRELRPEHLAISTGMRVAITEYLDERRLITTHVELASPDFQWITIQARIKTSSAFVNDRVKREAERRLYRFIRPLQGGPDPTMRFETPGEGWPFGRNLYFSEIIPILQTIEGVDYVEKVELFPVIDMARGQAGAPTQIINPGPRGLLCSYRHQIILI